MTKKLIILSNGVKKEMTFEEVLKQFDRMLNRFANTAIEKIVYNKPEKEDLMQHLRIQTWEAYQNYDGKHAFSTYLVPRLKCGINEGTNKLYAKKRTNNNGSISLDAKVNEDDTSIDELIGEYDGKIGNVDTVEFLQKLVEKLEPSEKILLRTLLDKKDFSIQNLALELGISRNGANKKYLKFKEKVKNFMRETEYVCC